LSSWAVFNRSQKSAACLFLSWQSVIAAGA